MPGKEIICPHCFSSTYAQTVRGCIEYTCSNTTTRLCIYRDTVVHVEVDRRPRPAPPTGRPIFGVPGEFDSE